MTKSPPPPNNNFVCNRFKFYETETEPDSYHSVTHVFTIWRKEKYCVCKKLKMLVNVMSSRLSEVLIKQFKVGQIFLIRVWAIGISTDSMFNVCV